MVESGLGERSDVSHFRLSAHLLIAFIIYIILLDKFCKNLPNKNDKPNYFTTKYNFQITNINVSIILVLITDEHNLVSSLNEALTELVAVSFHATELWERKVRANEDTIFLVTHSGRQLVLASKIRLC